MAIDLAGTLKWTRIALRTTEDDLPDADIEDIAASSVRRLLSLYPSIRTEGGSDLLGLTDDDRAAFDEASGFLVAARWAILPRPEGDEIVTRLKIGQLEEFYQVADLEALVAHYREEFRQAINTISFIAEAAVDAHLLGKGMPRIVTANRARYQATLDPNGAGAIAMLFSPRQEGLVGMDFGGDASNWG